MTYCYGAIDLKLNLKVKYAVFGVIAAVITVIDQLTKMWIVDITGGIEGKGCDVLENVFRFTYKMNDGASMGMLGGKRILLIVITLALLGLGIYYFVKHKPENMLFLIATSLIAGGALGNLIDRVMLGYVRDFIHLLFVDFYIFNVADCAICIGAGLLIIYAFKNVED